MRISVIIPTLGRDGYLKNALLDLLNQDADYSFEIIVMDQNALPLEERGRQLLSLSKKKQIKWVWFPGKNVVLSRNKGIDIAEGEIIVFLDDDIRIEDRYFLNKHMKAYNKFPEEAAAICGREINPGGAELTHALNYNRKNPISDIFFFPRNYFKRIEAAIFSTCNGSIRKQALIDTGCFDKNFFGASYGDDADLALRLIGKGYRIFYDPQPVVLHLLASKGGLRFSDKKSPFNHTEKVVSAWVFYFKHIQKNNTKFRFYYLYNYVIRKTLFLKLNLLRPWRFPMVLFGLVKAFFVVKGLLAERK